MESLKRLPLDTDSFLVHFDLPRLRSGAILDDWMQATGTLTEAEVQRLDKLYQKALRSGDGWNEEELKMKFISQILDLVDIEESNKIVSFYERPMSAVLKGVKIAVICDCLLASAAGIATPRTPYFFLQDGPPSRFKKQKGDSNDPEAQMLAAMLVAQDRNADGKPVYGAWLVGSIWNFTVLSGSEYFVSPKLDASDRDDLNRIVFILRRLKELILNR